MRRRVMVIAISPDLWFILGMGRPAPRSRRTLALKSAADALAEFMRKNGGAERAFLIRLWEHWEMVMGKDLAALAMPIGHKKDVLILAAEDSMAAQDIAMQAGDILEWVNTFMGRKYFSRIQVELVMGRNDLSRPLGELRPKPPEHRVPRPENLGSLLGKFDDPASPVARCYEAYLRYFSRSG